MGVKISSYYLEEILTTTRAQDGSIRQTLPAVTCVFHVNESLPYGILNLKKFLQEQRIHTEVGTWARLRSFG